LGDIDYFFEQEVDGNMVILAAAIKVHWNHACPAF